MSKNCKQVQSRFFCTKCGKEGLPVYRKMGQERKSGHLKKLYCLYCGEETNHCEIKDSGKYTYEDFEQEFKMGRFIEGKREALEDCLNCSKENCPFNLNGKCWNANNSIQCSHKPKESE